MLILDNIIYLNIYLIYIKYIYINAIKYSK